MMNSASDTWLYIVVRGRNNGGKKRREGIGGEKMEGKIPFAVCQGKTHGKRGHWSCVFPWHTAKKTQEISPARKTLGGKSWHARESGVDVALILCRVSVRGHTAKPCRRNSAVNCGSAGHVPRLFAVFLIFAVCFFGLLPCLLLCRVFF